MAIVIGIDIGQKSEPSSFCVAETQNRESSGRSAVNHLIRHLERLPIGTPFPAIGARVAEVSKGIDGKTASNPGIYVNVTGFGKPISDL